MYGFSDAFIPRIRLQKFEFSRSIHPSSWGRTPVSFPSMPTSRTTNSSGSGSSFSSYSPSFSHQYSSPEKTNNHRDRERFPSDIRTMTYSSYTEVPCSTCDNESFSRFQTLPVVSAKNVNHKSQGDKINN